MALNITNANEINKGKDFSALIFAQAGTGKTSTAKYLPGKTLVIDIDRTTNVLAGEDNIGIVYLDTNQPYLQTKLLLSEIQRNYLDDYDNIFMDNITEFENAWFSEKARESKTRSGEELGTPQMQDYNAYTYYMTDMIRFINSWEGVNKVYTAWETTRSIETSGGQTYNQFVPEIREKILNNVLGLMDLVGKLVISEDSGKRGYILEPSNSIFAKNQIDNRKWALQEDLFDFSSDID